MKRLLAILALLVATAYEVDAQNIRLGERIPTIHVDSRFGRELELTYKDYVCLLFINTKSRPCIEVIESLEYISRDYSHEVELIFVTNEERGCEANIAHLARKINYTMAYDIELRTFKAFGVEYVPCAVIYSTRRNLAEWFGAARQLTTATLSNIIEQ